MRTAVPWMARVAAVANGHADVSVVLVQLSPKEVDPTLATGALNNIIADNNLTAQFGSLQSASLADNATQAQLNQTLGPLQLYPLRIGGRAMAICNESFLTPRQYYALDVAYSSKACLVGCDNMCSIASPMSLIFECACLTLSIPGSMAAIIDQAGSARKLSLQ